MSYVENNEASSPESLGENPYRVEHPVTFHNYGINTLRKLFGILEVFSQSSYAW